MSEVVAGTDTAENAPDVLVDTPYVTMDYAANHNFIPCFVPIEYILCISF